MIRSAAARLPSATILAFVHFCKRFLLLLKWARVSLLQFTGGHTLRRILGAVRQGLHPGSALHRLDRYEPPLQERLHNIGAGFAYCTSRGSLQAETLISRTLESARAWFKENPLSVIVYLPGATYRGRVSDSPEAWFVWRRQSVETSVGQRIFLAI